MEEEDGRADEEDAPLQEDHGHLTNRLKLVFWEWGTDPPNVTKINWSVVERNNFSNEDEKGPTWVGSGGGRCRVYLLTSWEDKRRLL